MKHECVGSGLVATRDLWELVAGVPLLVKH